MLNIQNRACFKYSMFRIFNIWILFNIQKGALVSSRQNEMLIKVWSVKMGYWSKIVYQWYWGAASESADQRLIIAGQRCFVETDDWSKFFWSNVMGKRLLWSNGVKFCKLVKYWKPVQHWLAKTGSLIPPDRKGHWPKVYVVQNWSKQSAGHERTGFRKGALVKRC